MCATDFYVTRPIPNESLGQADPKTRSGILNYGFGSSEKKRNEKLLVPERVPILW